MVTGGTRFFTGPLKSGQAPERLRQVWSDFLGMLAAAALAAVMTEDLPAQASTPTEYEVQAAYLTRFGSFIQWPSTAPSEGPFTICVLGIDPFGPALDAAVEGQTVQGRPVLARRIVQPRSVQPCHILFISASEEARLEEILAALGNSSTLTVSDMPRFTLRGGMLQFTLVGSNVRFEVNETRAERAALTFSSQLLRLAVSVRREGE